MSHIYRSLPPAGTRIGIAFSGGLDTRAAVAWLAAQGLSVHGYTADLAQPDEDNAAAIPAILFTRSRTLQLRGRRLQPALACTFKRHMLCASNFELPDFANV